MKVDGRKMLQVQLSWEMHKALRWAALGQDRTLSAVVIEALEGWLEVNVADWSAPGGAEAWPEGDDVEDREIPSSACEHAWEAWPEGDDVEGNPWLQVLDRCRVCGEERRTARQEQSA